MQGRKFIFYTILFYFIILNIKVSFSKVINHGLVSRETGNCYKVEQSTYHVSLSFLVFTIFLMTLFCLIFLGIVKGILGLTCCAPVGMWGLGSLIDLPRPLEHYQESHLENIPVRYDQIGWPVHPHTGRRSVRALPKKTEFLLNVIFFLAYPLTMIITISSSCFNEGSNFENQYYQCVNTIVFDACATQRKKELQIQEQSEKTNKCACTYKDEDSAEDKDTNYVVYQMQRSKASLQRGYYNN